MSETPKSDGAQTEAPESNSPQRHWGAAFRDWRDWVFRSPQLRTACALVGAIITGVFSNTIVTEMTDRDGHLIWGAFYQTYSFYVLVVAIALNYVFHRHLFLHERRVDAFRDSEFCIAYARSQLIPEQVEATKLRIRQGKLDEFTDAMAQIKKVLK